VERGFAAIETEKALGKGHQLRPNQRLSRRIALFLTAKRR
jgi:hypothetical protein